MQISRKGLYKVSGIVVLVVTCLLIGFLLWQPGVNPHVLIGRDKAIQNAIAACDPGYGLQPMEQPTEVQAELTTYGRALHPQQPSSVFDPIDSATVVWVVKMKGRWMLVGGPAPDPSDPNPEPAYWDECTIIIDALTGESRSTPIE